MIAPKIQCPHCQSLRSKVVRSRQRPNRGAFRRRRKCEDCLKRYWTVEVVEDKKQGHI